MFGLWLWVKVVVSMDVLVPVRIATITIDVLRMTANIDIRIG